MSGLTCPLGWRERVDLYIRDVAPSPTRRSWRRASANSERLLVIHMKKHTQKKCCFLRRRQFGSPAGGSAPG